MTTGRLGDIVSGKEQKMEQKFVWNIAETVKTNPIREDQKLARTFLVHGTYCSALVVQAQPQTEPFLHIHQDHEEFLYVLEGEGWAYIGDKKIGVKPGDLVYCPAGVEHGFFMPVKGVRLSIYGPPFDPARPDRVVPKGEDLK
jgi:quercetin dioxygenase-like cupin family protein